MIQDVMKCVIYVLLPLVVGCTWFDFDPFGPRELECRDVPVVYMSVDERQGALLSDSIVYQRECDPGWESLCVVYVSAADFEEDPVATLRKVVSREQIQRCRPIQVVKVPFS